MAAEKNLKLKLRVWRQDKPETKGRFETYAATEVSPDVSFLEMLDGVNEQLILAGKEPIAFDHDCREGICGSCGCMVNGTAHGPERATTLCQLHMRHFRDGDVITIEPWRAASFPLIKDLVVNRSTLDDLIQAAGTISIHTGAAPEANSLLVSKDAADRAMDAAACIGCGACVAACPNASAMLFAGAKISHLAAFPRGEPERTQRAREMSSALSQIFGPCTNHLECEAVCPKEISRQFIARFQRETVRASIS